VIIPNNIGYESPYDNKPKRKEESTLERNRKWVDTYNLNRIRQMQEEEAEERRRKKLDELRRNDPEAYSRIMEQRKKVEQVKDSITRLFMLLILCFFLLLIAAGVVNYFANPDNSGSSSPVGFVLAKDRIKECCQRQRFGANREYSC